MDFLRASAANDHSSSQSKLAKFGFIANPKSDANLSSGTDIHFGSVVDDHSGGADANAKSAIIFGTFSDPVPWQALN